MSFSFVLVGTQKTENRKQKIENRKQKIENRKQKTENRKQKLESGEWRRTDSKGLTKCKHRLDVIFHGTMTSICDVSPEILKGNDVIDAVNGTSTRDTVIFFNGPIPASFLNGPTPATFQFFPLFKKRYNFYNK